MGAKVQNTILAVDKGENADSAVFTLHIDLPVPAAMTGDLRRALGEGRWSEVEEALVRLYPQHEAVINQWLEAAQRRTVASVSLSSSAEVKSAAEESIP